MENITRRGPNKKDEVLAEENLLKQDYEYLLNRERKVFREKEELLERLIKLKTLLKKVS